ncbi:LOW QUALITY PROTEIN: UPF0481 protein At3g47200 [Jatropha curcas]|uniref:LOW QUALITY PROTEIN: UPF0481 protein At3g47200 n=1 Tax=Jatropha curcas TaxID=180498 RepID=UPI00189337D7|nr:LOW QUALITY PROTEIN: UPF0481 protein At3g47200 [Jatropha curcas]
MEQQNNIFDIELLSLCRRLESKLVDKSPMFAKIVQPSEDDPLFKMPWLSKILMTELLLLENQLPWFVLHRLFDLTKVDHGAETRSLVELRNIILSGSDDAGGDFLRIPCVTDLLKAGIDFTVGEKTELVKIIFENGILTIPPLVILENAESLYGNLIAYEQVMRNLIAYEQCDRSLRDRITGYAAFLDNLIKSSEDLEYLKKKGIVYFYLSAEDISSFFNRLYKDADLVNYTYRKISEDVNAYCESLWPRWRTMLLRDYFNNPWSTMAFFFCATVILVLTFLQTLYAMLYH